MRKLFSTLLGLPVLLLLVGASVGCNTSVVPSTMTPTVLTPTATPTSEEQTITWSFWGDPWEVEVNERIIKVFEAEHPNIHVVALHEPWGGYFQQVEEWWKSSSPPDVMFLDFVPIYASRGLLEPLSPYMQRDNLGLEDFYPDLLNTFRYDGELYGLPRDNDTKVIFYNKTLFDKSGVPYPKADWTWDDLRETALKLTHRQGTQILQYGFAYEPDEWWRLWVWQNGGEVYDNDSDPTRTLMDSPEAIESIQWLADLTNVDLVTPVYEGQQSSLFIGHLFQEGKLAMAFGNHALVPAFASLPTLKWDVVGLPRRKAQVNTAGGSGYVISRSSAHKEAAWTFLKWLESPKGQAIFAETGVVVPSRRSVGQAPIFMQQERGHSAEVFLEETELGRAIPMFDGCQEALSMFNEALVPVWKGQMSAKQAIQGVTPKVNELLSKR